MTEQTMILTGRGLTGIFALFMLGASIAPKFLGASLTWDTVFDPCTNIAAPTARSARPTR